MLNWALMKTAVSAVITRQDFSPANPWLRRDVRGRPPPSSAVTSPATEEIEIRRARLWQTQGRLNAFWLPDGLAPNPVADGEADPD